MDLMCTSRISVQVAGRKTWRLYPLVGTEEEGEGEEEEEEEEVKGMGNWTEVDAVSVCLHDAMYG